MPELASLAGLCAWALALALVAGRTRARRAIAVVAAAAGLALPLFAPTEVVAVKALLADVAGYLLFRALDLSRDRGGMPLSRRAWHLTAFFDTRRARPVARRLDGAALARLVAYGALCFAGVWAAVRVAPALPPGARLPARWLAGAVFTYASLDLVVAALVLGYGLCGVGLPKLHDAPILSRSIGEFWGVRWNRAEGAWLREWCFAPLARRGHAFAGIAAAFLASGLHHAYFTWVALDAPAAAIMGAFFVAQIALCALERALGVARWPAPAARAWTVGVLLVASPLFVEPFLRVFEPLLL